MGKTRFAERVAEKLDYICVKEPEGENPFLSKFYESPSKYAFQTELYFLMTRLKVLRQIAYPVLFSGVVTDFTLSRSELYAKINLSESETRLYEEFLFELKKGMESPDAVYFLYASPDFVYYKLKKQGIRNLPELYIERLTDAFCDYYYNQYNGALLIIDVESVKIDVDQQELDRLIELLPEKGTMFYSMRRMII